MHVLILGMTRMGKTSLAIELAKKYKAMGKPVAYLTTVGRGGVPKDADRWAFADLVTADKAKFLRVLKSPKTWGVMAFIDEANVTIGHDDVEMQSLGTNGSMNKVTCHFLAVRAKTFSPTAREQCSELYLFRQGKESIKAIYDLFGFEQLYQAEKLDKGQYFHCTTSPGSLEFGDLGIGGKPWKPQL